MGKVSIYEIRNLIQDAIKARYPEADISSEDPHDNSLIIDINIGEDSGSIVVDWNGET